jgi:hypothetical protein
MLHHLVVTGSHYMSMQLDRDRAKLLHASETCETSCSPGVQARLWMYVGVYSGSGMQDYQGAQCAFRVALDWDPNVVLDEALCTPETKAVFRRAHIDACP